MRQASRRKHCQGKACSWKRKFRENVWVYIEVGRKVENYLWTLHTCSSAEQMVASCRGLKSGSTPALGRYNAEKVGICLALPGQVKPHSFVSLDQSYLGRGGIQGALVYWHLFLRSLGMTSHLRRWAFAGQIIAHLDFLTGWAQKSDLMLCQLGWRHLKDLQRVKLKSLMDPITNPVSSELVFSWKYKVNTVFSYFCSAEILVRESAFRT